MGDFEIEPRSGDHLRHVEAGRAALPIARYTSELRFPWVCPHNPNMKVLVPIKRVLDSALKARVNADRTAVDLTNLKMSINPFCEIAVEEAVRLKEQKCVSEVVAVSIGPKQSQETLRTALAMGADRAIHIQSELRTDQDLQPLIVSKFLTEIAKKEQFDLIILGKQSIDDDANQTGQMLAGLLQWPQATFASKISVNARDKKITVTREIEGGLQIVICNMPAVVTCDLRLNQPRYSSLPNIMKARKKPLETFDASSFGVNLESRLKILSMDNPPTRKSGIMIDSVKELMQKLKADGVLP